jgi:hypothetical protein
MLGLVRGDASDFDDHHGAAPPIHVSESTR